VTSQPELWKRIAAHEWDHAEDALPFSARLARENRWSGAYSRRVLAEYRRFAYLAMAAGHPVTPSDEVDQAWHLHMVYTRDYWDGFCGEVLRAPLHHGPTRGGQAENAKFEDWYGRTLDSYRREFGEEPPADIWPTASVRFGRAPHFKRVNVAENWVIPKRRFRLAAGASAAILFLGGAAPSDRRTGAILGLVAIIALVGFIIWLISRINRGGGSGCGSSGCSSSGGSDSFLFDSDGGSTDGGSSGCSSSGCSSSGCGGGCGGGD
jgi:hypothetical protein